MPKIVINGSEHEVAEGLTIIQACDSLGVSIPRFCYHDKLPSVGSCRMCMVEISGSRKLVPSCATTISEGMEVKTETPEIHKARKMVLEMLLINHPLDCPICDKGGECDLQDQTYRYGLDKSAINVVKRAVEEKDFGPLITPYMTRCIHCTRCIRFATEIAGIQELGALGRGDHTEISMYISKSLSSELSGNLAEVCPVGALTNSSYAFKARPWELISTETIDVLDAVGSNIKVDATGLAVLRIMPKINDSINESWIGDKSRYIVDALRIQRLDIPMIRINGKLVKSSWNEAMRTIADKLKSLQGSEIASLMGDFVDIETAFITKKLFNALGSDNIDCRFITNSAENNVIDVNFDVEDRGSYLFNTTIAGIEEADSCLIVGSNPRFEAPILNARLRKRYLRGGFEMAVIGEKYDGNYKYDYLGSNISLLQDILNGKHPFAEKLKSSKKPMLVLGIGAFVGNNSSDIVSLAKEIAIKYNMIQDNWNGYNVLNTSAGMLSSMEAGFVSKDKKINADSIVSATKAKNIKLLWLNNVDNIDFDSLPKDIFVVYQGHHGDKGAARADVILPSNLWLEQDGTYVNIEGRLQRSYQAVPTVGESKKSWKIIRKFAEYVGVDLKMETLEDLRKQISEVNPRFASMNFAVAEFKKDNLSMNFSLNGDVKSLITNYYITDIISKNSVKMAECTKLFVKKTA
ncbi:MAG: NADH-quinone oxidoreductase subunit NuoG [Alphaproteobacteria bacterium]|jgi:NADH-quinone oxidoreductase subunit G|nr:NADH-quinone oxidoreductase subunit NuoG [Alphaproteobacteria bacterium]